MSIELLHGDCLRLLKTLPDKSVDLVVTDPPYLKKGNGYYCGGGAFGTTKRDYHKELDDKKLLDGCSVEILEQIKRVMKKINLYIWCSKDQLFQYMSFFSDYNMDLLTWHKTNPTPTCNNKYLSDTEYLLFFRENGVKVYGTYETKRKFYVSATNKKDKELYQHPTIKPLDITENLILNSSMGGELVLDPFMGSGTTGVACKHLNRNFIGMELDFNYFMIASERIKNG